jgi:DNA polymerase
MNQQNAIKQFLVSLHHAGITHVTAPRISPEQLIRFQQQAEIVREQPSAATIPVAKTALPARAATIDESQTLANPPATVASLTENPVPVSPTVATLNSPGLLADQIADLPDLDLDQRTEALRVIQAEVSACQRCAELASTRTQTVFGSGNIQPRLLFLGEAPGAEEDRAGEPFVGKAGQKLTEIIENGMKLSRDDVYIMNVLKCRPPGNRNPTDQEAGNCSGFLARQIEIVRPAFICCLGGIAAKHLLASNLTIGKLRGKWHSYRGIPVIATYHPSYLLRNPSARKYVWEDIKMLLGAMQQN